jgi:hypothetical protein
MGRKSKGTHPLLEYKDKIQNCNTPASLTEQAHIVDWYHTYLLGHPGINIEIEEQ